MFPLFYVKLCLITTELPSKCHRSADLCKGAREAWKSIYRSWGIWACREMVQESIAYCDGLVWDGREWGTDRWNSGY